MFEIIFAIDILQKHEIVYRGYTFKYFNLLLATLTAKTYVNKVETPQVLDKVVSNMNLKNFK